MYLDRPIFSSGAFGARKVSKKVENVIFSCFEKKWHRKNFFGRIRPFPELPRIFRFLLGSATDDVREQIFGFKNPGQFFFFR